MALKSFYLVGEDGKMPEEIDISSAHDTNTLKQLTAAVFDIVEPAGTTNSSG